MRSARVAFGTFLGVPEPRDFGTADYVRTRWAADPQAAFAAMIDGELVGSNFATNWGSVGFFGPLTVRPDLWDQGVGKSLMEPVMDCFDTWENRHLGLFTFSHSPKHLELYRRYGFWPRFLTAVMNKQISGLAASRAGVTFAMLSAVERPDYLTACRALTDKPCTRAWIWNARSWRSHTQGSATPSCSRATASSTRLAVCHCGPGSEAGADCVPGQVRRRTPRPEAGDRFERLLDVCEQLAAERGLAKLDAGMNLGRPDAYQRMVDRGFRTGLQGVTMHRPNEPGYSHPDAYVIDDWR